MNAKNEAKFIELFEQMETKARNKAVKTLNKGQIFVNIQKEEDFLNLYDKNELAPALADYIEEKLPELKLPCTIELNFTVPSSFALSDEEICTTVEKFYENKAIKKHRFNNAENKKWYFRLFRGTFFLAACLVGASILNSSLFDAHSFAKVMSESLGIIGWVAIWEPADYFMFARRDNQNQLLRYIFLHQAEMKIKRTASCEMQGNATGAN